MIRVWSDCLWHGRDSAVPTAFIKAVSERMGEMNGRRGPNRGNPVTG